MDQDQHRASARSLPWWGILALVVLAAPRVVLHDLDLVHEGTVVNAVLVFVPPLVWIVTVVAWRVSRPLLTLVLVGLWYGVVLLVTHQLLWQSSLGGRDVSLGGNLAGLDPVLQQLVVRGFAAVSSLATGLLVGTVTGLVAWGVSAAAGRVRRG
ncbi:MAG TPA: hypothetical protein IAA98_10850 [Candidatus Avipropionibacterium avicola]|uniref:Uncharacterized protein n=1 Tax=Candidatus Avipropionibacterium avicola TaxID=2840701 RepID=A0A9D1H0Y2_9ACTN|nr:hypothetical protein [Candidatus Avipropionibacterium avicola]